MSTKLQKKSVTKKIEYNMSDSTTDCSNVESEKKDENEIEQSSNDKQSDPESENFCLEDKLVFLWASLSPPTKEDNLIQKWYGCIFMRILASRNILKSKLFTLAKFYVGSSAMRMVRHMG